MEYSFDIDLATKYGLDEAVLYKNILFWCQKNKANHRHFYDDKYWMYNSASAFSELFPFWNKKKIERLLQSLVDCGLIIKGEYNQNRYDRTLWYSAIESVACMSHICRMEATDLSHRYPENVAPIPDVNTDIITDRRTPTKKLPKNKYGSLDNVLLTDEELVKLYEKFGRADADKRIERLSLYVASKGDKYKSHYATILQWAQKDEQPSFVSKPSTPNNSIPNLWEQKL